MKKILTIVGSILFAGVSMTIITSCGRHKHESTPTEYFQLVCNDGTNNSYKVDTDTSHLSNTHITREGYTFLGVYSSTIGGIQYYNAEGYMVSEPQKDDILYIQWQINEYDLVFMAGDIEIHKEDDITYGTTLSSFPVPSEIPEGQEFEGWKDVNGNLISDGSGTPLHDTLTSEYYTLNNETKTLSFTASFKVKDYEVTYIFGGETEDQKITVLPGSVLELPEVSVENGYEFLGWSHINSFSNPDYYNGEPINDDTTLYAIVLQYKDFNLMNGTEVMKTERVYNDGKALDLDTLEVELKDGYEVAGWYSNQSMSGSSRVNTVSYGSPFSEFYADIQPITYTASFILGEGVTCDSSSVNYNVESEVTLPEAYKTNYEFIGWCTDEECDTSPITMIEEGKTGDFNLYPKFKGKDIKLTLNPNNGGFSTSSKKEYGKEFKLNIPVNDGYLFLGWYDQLEGGIQYTDGEGNSLQPLSVTENTTLYAHWSKKYHLNVTVTPQSAGELEVKEFYLENENVTLNFPTPTGYSMIGWFDGNDGLLSSNEEYSFTMPANDIDLTLKLDPDTYTVTFNSVPNGEFDNTPLVVTYGEPFTLPKVTRADYKFIGWHYDGKFLTDGEGQSLENWEITEDVTLSAFLVSANDNNGILIYDPTTLLEMKNDPTATYQVVFDVDMEGVEWDPFDFSGTLIGNNHTISNLTISPDTVKHTGMFSTLSGTVQDLNFENLNVTLTQTDYTNYYAVGGVCGALTGTLNNITVSSGKIEGGTTFNYTGGLVGGMTSGTIKNCINNAEVVSTSDYGTGGIVARFSGGTLAENENYGEVTGKQYTAGIVGLLQVGGNYTIANLTNNGEITGANYVGGIVGHINNYVSVSTNGYPTYTLTLTNLTNNGAITGESNVGGLAGRVNVHGDNSHWSGKDAYVKINASYVTSTGDITGASYVGGLIGSGYSDTSVSSLTNGTVSGSITGEYYVGGLVGKIENVKIANSTNENTTINATGFYLDTNTNIYYAYVGGYAGYGYMFENCENNSNITYTQKGDYVGGIAGYAHGAINSCTNTGNITASNSNYVGGIAGYVSLWADNSLTNLTNSGLIKGKNNVGGIVGHINNYVSVSTNGYPTYTLTLTNLTNNGAITGESNVGGLA